MKFAILTLVTLLLAVGLAWAIRRIRHLTNGLTISKADLIQLVKNDKELADLFALQAKQVQRIVKHHNFPQEVWVPGNGGIVAPGTPHNPKRALGGPSKE